ncbi:unnamed protein product [Pleuronectes platessa]|uniref:Uncharacterized protein n=1 Tax=Pleuronectes platessa TaxID=8262 RepID=A0A9N7VX22_PLEPL|nr:unnamed protein product [Pleuronectes platessa]
MRGSVLGQTLAKHLGILQEDVKGDDIQRDMQKATMGRYCMPFTGRVGKPHTMMTLENSSLPPSCVFHLVDYYLPVHRPWTVVKPLDRDNGWLTPYSGTNSGEANPESSLKHGGTQFWFGTLPHNCTKTVVKRQ